VEVGLGADQARRDHAGHILRVTQRRPRVLLKLAISADGKAGAAGGKSIAITGEEVRAQVHLLRAENDAIMVGIGTVLADDPQLTCRLPGMAKRSPVRVIADSALRLPLASQLAQSARDTPVWAICGSGVAGQAEADLRARGVDVMRSANSGNPLDLREVLSLLSAKGITRLMVEGGPTLAAAFIAADLVDEAALFHSPKTVGAGGVEALASPAMAALRARLKQVSSEPVGADRQDLYVRE
jgi:diaminohydroxyphosphoribosylaminopyrimidine deaminase/5-amino-6-(5-phosphoribosylamino)uracil reductase